ncbi:MAG: nuclease [Richelia sp. RM2_1_2]|nr:nuclease [Richelia sp. RM2_1_2]
MNLFKIAAILVLFTSPAYALTGKVVAVQDGDTITVLDNTNTQHRVRLASIDAPEKSQPFGNKSKQSLSDLVFGKQVTVTEDTRDRYGRTIGLVITGNVNANAEQVARGYAWVYTQYLNPRDSNFVQLQNTAKTNKLGLWADAAPTPPWTWRHSSKAANTSGKTCKQFATCEQARESLAEGNTSLDRDGDGVPCEALCR